MTIHRDPQGFRQPTCSAKNPLLPARFMVVALNFLALVMVGCASSPSNIRMGIEGPPPDDTNVDAAAWGADHFTFNKRMTIRSQNNFVFYFKHCGLIERRGPGSFYFQSEYGCTTP